MVLKRPLTSSEARILTDIDHLIFVTSQMDIDGKNDNLHMFIAASTKIWTTF